MSEREFELFVLAIQLAKQCADANPDVGMGPTFEMLARRVAAHLTFPIVNENIFQAAAAAENNYKYRKFS